MELSIGRVVFGDVGGVALGSPRFLKRGTRDACRENIEVGAADTGGRTLTAGMKSAALRRDRTSAFSKGEMKTLYRAVLLLCKHGVTLMIENWFGVVFRWFQGVVDRLADGQVCRLFKASRGVREGQLKR